MGSKEQALRAPVRAAMAAAVVFLLTVAVAVPIPGGAGYVNLGDAAVLAAGALLGPWWGAAAASLGAAMADLAAGFAVYAPATLLIKGGMAGLVGLLLRHREKRTGVLLLASLLTPLGYFVFDALLYGIGTAIAGLAANAVQALVGASVARALTAALREGIK